MKVKLAFFNDKIEKFFGVKPENFEFYFCSTLDGNNKTRHLLKRLISGSSSWISTENGLEGGVSYDKWLTVDGEFERWLYKKMNEFEFLLNYGDRGGINS